MENLQINSTNSEIRIEAPRALRVLPEANIQKKEAPLLSSWNLSVIKSYLAKFCPNTVVMYNASQVSKCIALRNDVYREEYSLTGSDEGDIRDRSALHLGVFDQGELIATTRVNLFDHSEAPDRELFDLETFESLYGEKIAMGSKIIVRRDERNGKLFKELMNAIYLVSLVSGCELLLGGCFPRLAPLYARYGSNIMKAAEEVSGFGGIVPMMLKLKEPHSWSRRNSNWEDILNTFLEEGPYLGLEKLN